MSAFRTITARFAGRCIRCQGAIQPGQQIRFAKSGKRSLTYHLSKDCPAAQPAPAPAAPAVASYDTPPAPAPRDAHDDTVPADRHDFGRCYDGRGGRCEDYPCCGCDGLHGADRFAPPDDHRGDEWWRWEG